MLRIPRNFAIIFLVVNSKINQILIFAFLGFAFNQAPWRQELTELLDKIIINNTSQEEFIEIKCELYKVIEGLPEGREVYINLLRAHLEACPDQEDSEMILNILKGYLDGAIFAGPPVTAVSSAPAALSSAEDKVDIRR